MDAVGMRRPALLLFALLLLQSGGFELQDTIHALIEENMQLHERLQNLTEALRDLRKLLRRHGDADNEEDVRRWDDWSEHGISAETHLLLEHVFCGRDLHGSAAPPTPPTLLLLGGVALLLSRSL